MSLDLALLEPVDDLCPQVERLSDDECRLPAACDTTSDEALLSPGPWRHREVRHPVNGGQVVVRFSEPAPPWLMSTIASLSHLLDLVDNWDSYGAPRIDTAFVKSAYELLGDVMRDATPAPAVVPTSRGGIQLEWHTRGIDLEVELETPSLIQAFFEDHRTGETWEKDVSFDLTPLAAALDELSRRE